MEEKKEKLPYETAELNIIEIQREQFLFDTGGNTGGGGSQGTDEEDPLGLNCGS